MAVPFEVANVTSVAPGHDGGGPASGTGQPAVPPVRVMVTSPWPVFSWATKTSAGEGDRPRLSSSLRVSVAVLRPTASAPALGEVRVRFRTLSAATTLLSRIGTDAVATVCPIANVTVPFTAV